jgi:hypothetical protein
MSRMPKRTNPRQQIIELLESMNEGPGCRVTPSGSLVDRRSGNEREVDVVVERIVDRKTITYSFEVLAHKRRADEEWIDRMIGKHETLPTDRLFLVSWSGFTGGARRQAAPHAKVELCTPDIVQGRDGPRIKTIHVGSLQMTPKETRLAFTRPDGSEGWIRSEPDIGLYSPTMEPVGPAQLLTDMLLRDPRVGPLARQNASVQPDRDNLKSFDLFAEVGDANLNLYDQELDELQHIGVIEVLGDFHFDEQRLDMEVRELRGQPFAHGSVELAGTRATLVTRLDASLEVITAGIGRFEPPKDGDVRGSSDLTALQGVSRFEADASRGSRTSPLI